VALDVAQRVPAPLLVITVSLMERVFQIRMVQLRTENVRVQLNISIKLPGKQAVHEKNL